MVKRADIESWFGPDIATYFANKRRGGDAGNKGTRYEEFFVAYKIAEALAALIDDAAAADPHVQAQVDAFVDDARIATPSKTDYFQLKNMVGIGWTAGDHPIATDFELQMRLSARCGEAAPSTTLVVPSANLAATLLDRIPPTIKAHTRVTHFPWTVTINRLVLESDTIRRLLSKLANIENASNDVLSGVFCALMNACLEKPDGGTVRELLAQAALLFPSQLRLLPSDENWTRYLREDFTQVLANIEGLSYGAARGFFHWSGFDTSGIFGQNVLSDAFRTFQGDIVKHRPATFEEFEKVLP